MNATAAEVAPRPRRWLRFLLILLPAVAFIGLLAYGLARTGTVPQPGDEAPAFEAPLLEGDGSLGLDELRGRPVVLNFWASWCVPCRDEAPLLASAHRRLGDKVAFVGVDIRDSKTDALAFQERYGMTYPSVRDESLQIYEDYGLTGQPETFFIDADGIIVEHVPGAMSEDLFLRELDVLLRRTSDAPGAG